jgi:putative ABC transport system substrate-binding protein
MQAFLRGLSELGYVEGKNIAIEYRYTEGSNDRLPALAAELVGLKVDIIVTETGTGALRAQGATRTIPIVMESSNDAVGQGIIASLDHPGGNITGLTAVASDLAGKRLQLLAEVVPNLAHVGVLWAGGSGPVSDREWAQTRAAAGPLNVQLHSLEAHDPAGISEAFAEATRQHVQAILQFDVNAYGAAATQLADLAVKNHLPMMFQDAGFVVRGGLIAYGVNNMDLARRAASYVDRILKGANPADLAVGIPDRFVLTVNLNTAKALGLTIPQSITSQADIVGD